jgi:hypothetical protein
MHLMVGTRYLDAGGGRFGLDIEALWSASVAAAISTRSHRRRAVGQGCERSVSSGEPIDSDWAGREGRGVRARAACMHARPWADTV